MTTISREELDGIYAFAVELGKQAGDMLMDAAQIRMDGGNASAEQKEHVQKENAVDLVTETDESMLARKQSPLPHFRNVTA
jgi:myo-inositol-1(or 4)-monophosphatase|tara:strand:+ start:4618 stop:4860 length:243 start_codon:yes stop_codon:yes gene_type:complete